MSSTAVQSALRVRYGHKSGDLLMIHLRSGECLTAADGAVSEDRETEIVIAQVALEVSESTLTLQNSRLSITTRAGQEYQDLPCPANRQELTLKRNGAPLESQEPLGLFAFPERELGPGDHWECALSLSCAQGEPVPATLRCTVVESDEPGILKAKMECPGVPLQSGDGRTFQVSVSGRLEFSLEHGYLKHGSLENQQLDAATGQCWKQWLVQEVRQRIEGPDDDE